MPDVLELLFLDFFRSRVLFRVNLGSSAYASIETSGAKRRGDRRDELKIKMKIPRDARV